MHAVPARTRSRKHPTSTTSTARPAASGGTDAVRAEHLVKDYGSGETAVRALNHVDVSFPVGRFAAIMGPSGSGKSTLVHCLAGLDVATSGRVWLGTTDISDLGDTALTRLRRTRVGFVFQAFNLLPTLSAEQNMVLPLTLAGRRPDREWLTEVMTALGLGDRLTHRPHQLSGGQQQRVAIARALVTRPDVVFADEPTGNLDSRSSAEVLSLLRTSVRELGQTVVMVTHDPNAASYADRVVLLADGRLAGEVLDPTADTVIDALRALGA